MNAEFPKPEIIFEDANVLVLDKPAGLLSQPDASKTPSLIEWAQEYLGRPYVGLVHRLDRNTSGIMILAKRTKAAQRLTRALQNDEIYRSYLTLLEGSLMEAKSMKHFLLKNEVTNTVKVVLTGGKEALLIVNPIRRFTHSGVSLTLAEVELQTGRSHQIRVQLAHEKFPLLGDSKYSHASPLIGRPALHSYRLRFPHPISKEILSFEANIPADFQKLI